MISVNSTFFLNSTVLDNSTRYRDKTHLQSKFCVNRRKHNVVVSSSISIFALKYSVAGFNMVDEALKQYVSSAIAYGTP